MWRRAIILSELEKRIIYELQDGLPLAARPYHLIASKIGISEDELLQKINEFIDKGILRRMGAALRHQRVGFTANAMAVWKAPKGKIQEIGTKMASFEEVTHCYERVTRENWPYNLYTVFHGSSKDECYKIADDISRATGLKEYRLLFSTQELKKSSMIYFPEYKDR